MNLSFRNKRIAGVVTVVPKDVFYFSDEIANYNFPRASSLKLQKMLGLESHRYLRDENATGSDMGLAGIRYLFDRGLVNKEEIQALIYVTQTPDYFIPPTSNVMQGALGLGHDVLCMDINQGCAGFLIGLMQGFMLLDLGLRGVLLVNADTASKQAYKGDRNTFPLVGDAASVVVLENSDAASPVWMNLKMDGSRWQALHIPAGGYRLRPSAETAALQDLGNGNFRSKEHIHMDGNAIFNFTMTEVPEMIADILTCSGRTIESIDYFLFHQPNKFILEQLAQKLQVPMSKLPVNISSMYGNASSVSIPMTICHAVGEKLLGNRYAVCLAGFGVGLTWSSMVLEMGPMDFCTMIEF